MRGLFKKHRDWFNNFGSGYIARRDHTFNYSPDGLVKAAITCLFHETNKSFIANTFGYARNENIQYLQDIFGKSIF